jgi:hypothetical protein
LLAQKKKGREMQGSQDVVNLLDNERDDPSRLRLIAAQLCEEGWRKEVDQWFAIPQNRELANQIGWRVREKTRT